LDKHPLYIIKSSEKMDRKLWKEHEKLRKLNNVEDKKKYFAQP
jgi:hypothetical protein